MEISMGNNSCFECIYLEKSKNPTICSHFSCCHPEFLVRFIGNLVGDDLDRCGRYCDSFFRKLGKD
jgi:hypothetical protein